jgi:hypothetical protein
MTTKQLQEYLVGRHIYVGTYLHDRETKLRYKVKAIKIWKRLRSGEHPAFRISLKFGLYRWCRIERFDNLHTNFLSEWEQQSFNKH